VSDDLKCERQCASVVKKANRVLGMINQNLIDMSKETILALQKSITHLEYRMLVWNPYLVKDIKLIENVQHRATKLVQGIRYWSYDERLRYLELIRLDKRNSQK